MPHPKLITEEVSICNVYSSNKGVSVIYEDDFSVVTVMPNVVCYA